MKISLKHHYYSFNSVIHQILITLILNYVKKNEDKEEDPCREKGKARVEMTANMLVSDASI